MCGVAGILALQGGAPVQHEALIRLRDAQAHRGPDDAGHWFDANARVGFGHRRLSIIDLTPSGHQPMHTKDGRLHIVFNGEIYNFLELKTELEQAGYVFESTSDTEVLLHGYKEWKLDLLPRLRGMFAFALHDAEEKLTLLARDPLGIKPLYYAEIDHSFYFASEVQAIHSVADVGGTDPESVAAYLHWGYVAAPRTIYRRVRALPAGHTMVVREESVSTPRAYYTLKDSLDQTENMDATEAAEHIRDALLDSIRCHMIADVEVGAFLSGGVDSTSLVGLMSEVHDGPISTVNLSFDVAAYDEGDLAEQAAHLYGSRHHRINVRIEEVRDRVIESVQALDQPSIDGPNLYLVSQAAVEAGLKVAVAGVGGDELFGGYSTFSNVLRVFDLHQRSEKIPGGPGLVSAAASLLNVLPKNHRTTTLYRALSYGSGMSAAYSATRSLFTPREVRSLLAPEYKSLVDATDPAAEIDGSLDPGSIPRDQQVSFLELQRYLQGQLLRDADAMSMQHSLEVRTPLVDHVLLKELFKVPSQFRQSGPAKRSLRESVRPPLPDLYWNRPKKGFSLPFSEWIQSGSLSLEFPDHPILDSSSVRKLEQQFSQSRILWSRLWALLTLTPFLE